MPYLHLASSGENNCYRKPHCPPTIRAVGGLEPEYSWHVESWLMTWKFMLPSYSSIRFLPSKSTFQPQDWMNLLKLGTTIADSDNLQLVSSERQPTPADYDTSNTGFLIQNLRGQFQWVATKTLRHVPFTKSIRKWQPLQNLHGQRIIIIEGEKYG